MKLLNDFFKIRQTETVGDTIRFQTRMNRQHVIYQAHFPNSPVTPGVCLVQMATELLQNTQIVIKSIQSISKIKYRHVVRPWDEPWFEFSHIVSDGEKCKVRVSVYSEDHTFAQMSLTYWSKHE